MTQHLSKIVVWPFCVLAVLAVASGCKKREEAVKAAPPDVEVVPVAQRDVPIYREWVGTVEGEVNATISAQVSGYLLSREYVEGGDVTNGQVLFKIDPAPFEAALAQAKAQLTEAQAKKGKTALDVERYTPLAASQAISKQELDDAIQADKAAAGQVASAVAAAQAAQLNLDFTTIRAPVNGNAGLAKAQIGNLVGPSSGPLTTVVQTDPMRVYFSLSQQLLTQVMERRIADGKDAREGEGPELNLILPTGNIYSETGHVQFANNLVDQRTGTITLVGRFANPKQLLVPGMFVRVKALLNIQTNALLVPQRSVTDMQGRALIAVVGADNKVSIRSVTTGDRIDQECIVSGELKPGDRVVAEGIQKVRDGMVVNPLPFGQTPAQKPEAATASAQKVEAKKP